MWHRGERGVVTARRGDRRRPRNPSADLLTPADQRQLIANRPSRIVSRLSQCSNGEEDRVCAPLLIRTT